ncbi:MAG: metal ABC transporter permease [Zavarzinella sp.]
MMNWLQLHELDIWTVVVGILCSVPCAMLGCYLLLRKMSLLGDAISHAILPGLVVAFLLTGTLSGWAMAMGAGILGILTAYFTQAINRWTAVSEDASMGVVFTSLFALGVILISRYASQVDLDPGCVLYGLIEFTALDTVEIWGWDVPRSCLSLAPLLLVTILFVVLFWKELKLVAFDSALADAMGFRSSRVHYLLMAMVASATVASFEAVGSILVVAMLIVPPATAHLLCDRLKSMMMVAVLISVLSTILGYIGAVYWNTSVAGMMASTSGAIFALTVFIAPQHGLISKWLRRNWLMLTITLEDVLGELYRKEENNRSTRKIPAPAWWRRLARNYGWYRGLLNYQAGQFQLTPAGREKASQLVRTHRLWETFLSTHLDLPSDHLHDPADRMEHFISPDLHQQIASELAHPKLDPHGKPIPDKPE